MTRINLSMLETLDDVPTIQKLKHRAPEDKKAFERKMQEKARQAERSLARVLKTTC